MESDHIIFSILKKVLHTQNATIKLLEKEIGLLSYNEKEKILQLKDSQMVSPHLFGQLKMDQTSSFDILWNLYNLQQNRHLHLS